MSRCLLAASMAVALCCAACPAAVLEPPPQIGQEVPLSSQPVRRFAFRTLDGAWISTASLRGRMSVVVMAATFDAASQVQARFLKQVAHSHKPRINALLVVLEPAHHEPLVRSFVNTFQLPYPVVMADADTLAGRGPFQGLHHVPAVVLLDRDGREVWRRLGLIEAKPLSAAIAAHDPHAGTGAQ